MDTALQLRMAVDRQEELDDRQVDAFLATSSLVNRLISNPVTRPLPAVWRLIALSEIPYTNRLVYTKQLADWALSTLSTTQGFSVMGGPADLLPCYNAMLVYALSKLGYANRPQVEAGVEWIRLYQPFNRQVKSIWEGKGTQKYGGCLKATPCYIGIVKAVKALQAYRDAIQTPIPDLQDRINAGVEYILEHHLYQRRHDNKPITIHILDLAFPESYNLNILEILQVIACENRLMDVRCTPALEYLESIRNQKTGQWKVTFRYKGDGYMDFDSGRTPAEWVTYLCGRYLGYRVQ